MTTNPYVGIDFFPDPPLAEVPDTVAAPMIHAFASADGNTRIDMPESWYKLFKLHDGTEFDRMLLFLAARQEAKESLLATAKRLTSVV